MSLGFALHWKERLTENDLDQIQNVIDQFKEGSIDEDELYDELIETEMFIEEVEEFVESLV